MAPSPLLGALQEFDRPAAVTFLLKSGTRITGVLDMPPRDLVEDPVLSIYDALDPDHPDIDIFYLLLSEVAAFGLAPESKIDRSKCHLHGRTRGTDDDDVCMCAVRDFGL